MLILAKTQEGSEYLYSRLECYTVSKSKGTYIRNILNANKWNIKDNEKWFLYDIGEWEYQDTMAQYQKLIYRKGKIILSKS